MSHNTAESTAGSTELLSIHSDGYFAESRNALQDEDVNKLSRLFIGR
jgi:hypothetical protein